MMACVRVCVRERWHTCVQAGVRAYVRGWCVQDGAAAEELKADQLPK